MDTTYMDTLKAQIKGNALLDYRDANQLIDIIKNKGETFAKTVVKSNKKRFFYETSLEGVAEKIKENLTAGQLRYEQGRANKMAREGVYVSKIFETTYERGGHKYVNGNRVY